MSIVTIEERVSELERKVAMITGEQIKLESRPWWEQWSGAFENDPDFDAAMERGAEYRRSQPNPADDFDAVELERQEDSNN